MRHGFPKYLCRVNYKANTYFEIAYEKFINSLIHFENLNYTNFDNVNIYKKSLSENYYIIIVFCTMALEAFVNDYLAVYFTDNFFYENFDKLNIKQKIEIIFNIIWEDEFDKSGVLYKYLHELIKKRNLFVHSKTKAFSPQLIENEDKNIPLIDLTNDNSDDNYFKSLTKSDLDECLKMMKELSEAIKTFYLFCKSVDEHDSNCYAVSSLMSCTTRKEIFYIDDLSEEICKEMRFVENRISVLKKKHK